MPVNDVRQENCKCRLQDKGTAFGTFRHIWEKRFAKGVEAARKGKSKESCPYLTDDARGAWLAGWSSVRG